MAVFRRSDEAKAQMALKVLEYCRRLVNSDAVKVAECPTDMGVGVR